MMNRKDGFGPAWLWLIGLAAVLLLIVFVIGPMAASCIESEPSEEMEVTSGPFPGYEKFRGPHD